MKKILYYCNTVLILFPYFFNIKTVLAQTMVVTDPGAYTYLNGLDKKLQEGLGFLNKIQDADLQIQASVSGNKKVGYGLNANLISYDDYFQLRNTISLDTRQNNLSTEKPSAIARNLDQIFPPFKIKLKNNASSKEDKDFEKKNYQQNNIKASIIFAEMILASSKARVSQIKSLATDMDATSTVKEAMDVNNRLILELITEARNTNLLLANLIKMQGSKDYEGSVMADYVQEDDENMEELLKGRSGLGASISRPSKGGKFTTITR